MKTPIQKKIAQKAGITAQYLSFILNKKRENVSIPVAKKLSEASQELGFAFTPEDWTFRPEIIKQHLKEHRIHGKGDQTNGKRTNNIKLTSARSNGNSHQ